jgi:hypothetical protein
MNAKALSAATIGLSLVAASQHALGSFSYLKPNLDEATPEMVFADLYGKSFEQVGVDYVSDHAALRRVSDDHDQFWTGTFEVSLVARFSGFTQAIGSLSKGSYQDLIEAEGMGFDPAPGMTASVTLDDGVWVRSGDSGTHASAPRFNDDGRDHMITYRYEPHGTLDKVASPIDSRVWVLFWEDLDMGPTITKNRSVSDFNDLVVMIRDVEDANPASPIAVPLPPAFAVGLATMGLGAIVLRKRYARA